MDGKRQNGQVRINLGLTAGIMATVMIALLLAQLDALRDQSPYTARALPIVNVQATAIREGEIITLTYSASTGEQAFGLPLAALPGPDLNPRATVVPGSGGNDAVFTVCGEVPAGWLLYTVQDGETLASLASGTQTDSALIALANCLDGTPLTAGMQLLLPSEPIAALQCGPPQWWVRYQVRPGDTMLSLAVSRGTSVEAVLQANCRDSVSLTAGQMIFLPPGSSAPPVVAPPVVATTPPLATATSEALPTPVPPTTAPPTSPPAATATIPPATIAPTAVPTLVPTFVPPTATPPSVTATPPVLPTSVPPTAVPPTSVPPTTAPPTATAVPPTVVPPTAVPPTAVPPTAVPPTATPPPPPTATPPPAPTNTPEPPPTNTPEPDPTDPPPPTATPVPEPTEGSDRADGQQGYWR